MSPIPHLEVARPARPLALLLAALALGGAPGAQIVAARFVDADAAAKFRRETVLLGDEPAVVGELKDPEDTRQIGLPWPEKRRLELIPLDQRAPTHVPYSLKDGERTGLRSSDVVGIPGTYLRGIELLLPAASVHSVAAEVAFRQARLKDVRRSKLRLSKDPSRRAVHELLVVTELEELRSFAETVGLVELAADTWRDVARAYADLDDEPLARGGPAGFARVERLATPEDLRQASAAISGDPELFSVLQSRHARLTFDRRVPAERAERALVLLETAIEGFRRRMVQAAPEDGTGGALEDRIPDRVFSEFWLGPDDPRQHAWYFEEYLGFSWGEGALRDELLRYRTKFETRDTPPENFTYTRYVEGDRFEQTLLHDLGHQLARCQFERGLEPGPRDARLPMPWLQEACGLSLALEYLGRDDLVCTAFDANSLTAHGRTPTQDRYETYREYCERLALDSGRRLQAIAVAGFVELDRRDVAKAWSLTDRLLRGEDGLGQRFLSLAGEAAADRATFQARWIADVQHLLGLTDGNPFAVLEDRWRASLEAE